MIFVDLMDLYGLPWEVAVLIIVVAGVVLGAIHGFLITKLKMQPFVVTLCGLLIYRGLARWYTEDGTAGFSSARPSRLWNGSPPDAPLR